MEALFPDIRGGIVAIDTEGNDKGLGAEKGPGWAWKGGGELIGASFYTPEHSGYLAFGHIEGNNCDKQKALAYITDLIKNPDITPVFANSPFDLGWIRRETGFSTSRTVEDVQLMAPLIDEQKFSYSLDHLSLEYLDKRKNEEELNAYAAERGWKDVKSRMKDIPGHIVGRYAIPDAQLTYELHEKFKPLLDEEDLWNVYNLEKRLVPLLIEMRWRGVRVDLDYAEQLGKKYLQIEKDAIELVRRETGINISLTVAGDIAKVLDSLQIPYPLTEKAKKPSIKNSYLESLDNPLCQAIARARKFQKARRTFIENSVLENEHDGRIHASFNQLKAERDEDGKSTGTVSGRFSSTEPNLQQIPARDPEIGPAIRSIYLPEEGEQWGALDYSAQEPRVMTHFAELAEIQGAKEFADMYRADPRMDFHDKTRDAVRLVRPGFERKPAKIIGLGLAYGMGGGKLCRSLGFPTTMKFMFGKEIEVAGPEGQQVLDAFNQGVPWLKKMAKFCSDRAKARGYIKTPTGRKFRFPIIGGQRMYLHKAFNRLVQGTSACMMKTSMVECWESERIVPLATVHDELDISFGDKKILDRTEEIMRTAFPLTIPIVVDVEVGESWGASMGK